jgi:hypothetical protein
VTSLATLRARAARRLGAAFLDEADQGIDHHHAEDHPGVGPFAEEGATRR